MESKARNSHDSALLFTRIARIDQRLRTKVKDENKTDSKWKMKDSIENNEGTLRYELKKSNGHQKKGYDKSNRKLSKHQQSQRPSRKPLPHGIMHAAYHHHNRKYSINARNTARSYRYSGSNGIESISEADNEMCMTNEYSSSMKSTDGSKDNSIDVPSRPLRSGHKRIRPLSVGPRLSLCGSRATSARPHSEPGPRGNRRLW